MFILIFLIVAGLATFISWRTHRLSCEAEGRALNVEMFQKYEDEFKKLNEAYTQLEMNIASAEIRSAVAPYLFLKRIMQITLRFLTFLSKRFKRFKAVKTA